VVDQRAALLMCEVSTPIGRALVSMVDCAQHFATLRTTFGVLFLLALKTGNICCVAFHPALARNDVTRRQHGERFQTQVNTHHLAHYRQRFRLDFARETGVPVAHAIATQGQRFWRACKRAVQFDFHVTNLGEPQSPIFKKTPVAPLLRERETIVPAPPLEAGIPWILTRLHTAEERTKRQIDTLLCFLLRLGVALRKPGVARAPFCQQMRGVITRQAFLSLPPCRLANLKRLVIYPSAAIKLSLQSCALRGGGKETVLERFSHGLSITHLAIRRKSLYSSNRYFWGNSHAETK